MAQTIRMVYKDLNQIEMKLEAYEAHLDLFDTSTQVMDQLSTAFTAQFCAQDQNGNRLRVSRGGLTRNLGGPTQHVHSFL
jgi:hypothetical protein